MHDTTDKTRTRVVLYCAGCGISKLTVSIGVFTSAELLRRELDSLGWALAIVEHDPGAFEWFCPQCIPSIA